MSGQRSPSVSLCVTPVCQVRREGASLSPGVRPVRSWCLGPLCRAKGEGRAWPGARASRAPPLGLSSQTRGPGALCTPHWGFPQPESARQSRVGGLPHQLMGSDPRLGGAAQWAPVPGQRAHLQFCEK